MDTTRTARFLLGPPPDGVIRLDGPIPPAPPGRFPISRLGIAFTEKYDYTPDQLARSIAEFEEGTIFLCDSSFFDRNTHQSVFEALVSREDGLNIIPAVFLESEGWAKKNEDLPIAKMLMERHTSIKMINPPGPGEPARYGYAYFMRLLGTRKLLFPLMEDRFEHDHGRPPTPEEKRSLARDAHDKLVGPRGYMIGRKAAGQSPSPTFYTDEQVVVTAFMLALAMEAEVVILTKDEDIQEQFYKMQYMLDTQYRSMLFAERYAECPSSFVTRPLQKSDDRILQCFIGDDDILVQKPGDNLVSVLPEEYRPVCIYCWVAEKKMSRMVFNAETGMRRLFAMKAKTDGLNTDRLDGRNCHTWLDPLPISPIGRWAAIGRDSMVKAPDCRIPFLELNQSINCHERFRHIIYDGSPDR